MDASFDASRPQTMESNNKTKTNTTGATNSVHGAKDENSWILQHPLRPVLLHPEEVGPWDAVINCSGRYDEPGQIQYKKLKGNQRRKKGEAYGVTPGVIAAFKNPVDENGEPIRNKNGTIVQPKLLIQVYRYREATEEEVADNLRSNSYRDKKMIGVITKKKAVRANPKLVVKSDAVVSSGIELQRQQQRQLFPYMKFRKFLETYKRKIHDEREGGKDDDYSPESSQFRLYLDSLLTSPFVNETLTSSMQSKDIYGDGMAHQKTRELIVIWWNTLRVSSPSSSARVRAHVKPGRYVPSSFPSQYDAQYDDDFYVTANEDMDEDDSDKEEEEFDNDDNYPSSGAHVKQAIDISDKGLSSGTLQSLDLSNRKIPGDYSGANSVGSKRIIQTDPGDDPTNQKRHKTSKRESSTSLMNRTSRPEDGVVSFDSVDASSKTGNSCSSAHVGLTKDDSVSREIAGGGIAALIQVIEDYKYDDEYNNHHHRQQQQQTEGDSTSSPHYHRNPRVASQVKDPMCGPSCYKGEHASSYEEIRPTINSQLLNQKHHKKPKGESTSLRGGTSVLEDGRGFIGSADLSYTTKNNSSTSSSYCLLGRNGIGEKDSSSPPTTQLTNSTALVTVATGVSKEESNNLFTKDGVTPYDAVLNAVNRNKEPGQIRWFDMREPRRSLEKRLGEAQMLVDQFQQGMIIDENDCNQKKRVITPRLLWCADKEKKLYRHAHLSEVIKNVNSKRSNARKKEKKFCQEPEFTVPSTTSPTTRTFCEDPNPLLAKSAEVLARSAELPAQSVAGLETREFIFRYGWQGRR